jgi:hypothetical protein
MAITDINVTGYVFKGDGNPLEGATVELLETGTTTVEATYSGGTTAAGLWTFTETSLDTTYDVRTTSGTSKRLRMWADEITLKTVDVSQAKIRGTEGAAAPLYFFADQADDAGDSWRIQASASDTLAIGSDKNTAGTIIDYLTITNGANAAASVVALGGDLTVGDDLSLTSDSAVFNMGAGNDFTITHDGSQGATLAGAPIAVNSTGALTLDSSTDITLDAGGADIFLKDDGTLFGTLNNNSGELLIKSSSSGTTAATFTGANVVFAGTVDATTGFTIGSTVITDDSIVMTPSANDTVTLTASANGAFSLVTVDNAATDAAISVVADGTFIAQGTTVTLDANQDVVLSADGGNVTMDDGTITIFDFDVDNTTLTIHDDQDTGDKAVISMAQHGALSIVTTDDDAAAADFTIDADGEIVIDAADAAGTIFKIAGTAQLSVIDGSILPTTDSDIDLGSSSYQFKDAYIHGTLEADAITVGGTNVVTGGVITTLGTISVGVWEGTDVGVAHGGTGASSLIDGGVLLGSGTGAITAMTALSDSQMIVGNGTTDPVAESGATLRTSIGVGTGDSPQFTDLTLTDDLLLTSDGAVINFTDGGSTGAITLTHANDELTLKSGAGNTLLGIDAASGSESILRFREGGTDKFQLVNAPGSNWLAFYNHQSGGGDVWRVRDGQDDLEVVQRLFINENANAEMTQGITINQGANDDEILAFKSSDVTHTATGSQAGATQDDTYGNVQKRGDATGGLFIRGYSSANEGVVVEGFSTTDNADKTTGAGAAVMLVANKITSNERGAQGANANIVSFITYNTTRFIFDAEGDFHYDGSLTAFADEFDDAHLVRALDYVREAKGTKGLIRSKWDDFVKYSENTLIELGILGDTIENGGLINMTGLQRLHNSAIWQGYVRQQEMQERIEVMETKLLALQEAN